ncbi:MAG TPA: response regulator [Bacteroidales bacterium]|nr:response regulator [Bacteroidales bacterium]HSA42516.1 response regulator [Bacteroidales bacterium]
MISNELQKFAKTLSPINSVWIEDFPDTVMGYANSLSYRSNGIISCKVFDSPLSARKFIRNENPSFYILDIKLGTNSDGIVYAQNIRKQSLSVPIAIVSSFISEYYKRIQNIRNLSAFHDRTKLTGKEFRLFSSLVNQLSISNRVLQHLNGLSIRWEDFYYSDYQDLILESHYNLFLPIALSQFRKQAVQWVAFVGDEIVDGSKNLRDMPDYEKKLKMAEKYKKVPYIYTRPIISEEGITSEETGLDGLLLDQYPKTIMQVEQKIANADFDSGTNQTIVSDQITAPDIGSSFMRGDHLGEPYKYTINQRNISFASDNGKNSIGPFKMPVAIVKNWKSSPWIIINNKREALLGRDIFLIDSIELNIKSTKNPKGVLTTIKKS